MANRPVPTRGLDKVVRAEASTPTIEAGKVFLPDPEHLDVSWLADYLTEFGNFPSSDYHDDDVDATTQFLNWVRNEGRSRWAVQEYL